jgi:8-oxo-dGTP diphosphatase
VRQVEYLSISSVLECSDANENLCSARSSREGNKFLVVQRPNDPEDRPAGVWGFPAVTLQPGEDERAAAHRVGKLKLGVGLSIGKKVGEKTGDRGSYLLHLSDYEATIVEGTPSVPQSDGSVTQYADYRFTDDPTVLFEAARKGSLCSQVFLESIGRRWEAD